jgi:hypothetical protein
MAIIAQAWLSDTTSVTNIANRRDDVPGRIKPGPVTFDINNDIKNADCGKPYKVKIALKSEPKDKSLIGETCMKLHEKVCNTNDLFKGVCDGYLEADLVFICPDAPLQDFGERDIRVLLSMPPAEVALDAKNRDVQKIPASMVVADANSDFFVELNVDIGAKVLDKKGNIKFYYIYCVSPVLTTKVSMN